MLPDETEEGRPCKQERLLEIFRRIADAPNSATFDEAYHLLCTTMDEVEDELTGLPNEPDRWQEIPRLFPPQMDRMSSIVGYPVKRFDSLRHVTYIADNGAIEVRSLRVVDNKPTIHFTKAGADGKRISDVCPELVKANL